MAGSVSGPAGPHSITYPGQLSRDGAGIAARHLHFHAAGNTDTPTIAEAPHTRRVPSKTGRELIKKIWEVDPLSCPRCGHEMKIISLIYEPDPQSTQCAERPICSELPIITTSTVAHRDGSCLHIPRNRPQNVLDRIDNTRNHNSA